MTTASILPETAPERDLVPENRPLSIPVILGTSRKGRLSSHAARFVCRELEKRDGVRTELIDIGRLMHQLDDNGQGTGDAAFAASMAQADAIVIVTPEYNHAMPGLLKHVLDSCLKEYIHKAAGIVAVSAGPEGGLTAVWKTASPGCGTPDWMSAAANCPSFSPVQRRFDTRSSGPRVVRMPPVSMSHGP